MIFENTIIDRMTEADVRAEIIDPILAKLGFRFGTKHYVERERKLLYPYTFIGHKSRKDVPVGSADYICGVDGQRGAFAVEAKRGDLPISNADVEQAHSYAVHPEVRADFFVLSNGHQFSIYETMRGSADEPVVSVANSELDKRFFEIEALLAPVCLAKNCTRTFDLGRPLAAGRGSRLELGAGWIRTLVSEASVDAPHDSAVFQQIVASGLFEKMQNDLEEIRQYRQPIVGGIVRREEDGRMRADVEFSSANDKLAHNLAAMNLQRISFFANSSDFDANPFTLFETLREGTVPEGTEVYPGIRGNLEKTGVTVEFALQYRVLGQLVGDRFFGNYMGLSVLVARSPFIAIPPLILRHEGEFETAVR